MFVTDWLTFKKQLLVTGEANINDCLQTWDDKDWSKYTLQFLKYA